MKPSEIACLTVNSPVIVEGLTHRERFYFICEVLQCEGISLGDQFDYDAAIETNDCEMIMAAMHLATLQFEFVTRCHLQGHYTDEQSEWLTSYLLLAKSKMRWAYSFLQLGKEPPPFPAVN